MKCAVVTPVGPGHKDLYRECLASILRAQKHSLGRFDEIIPISVDDTRGEGRSRARNAGISQAREAGADWIFFIDADDVLLENTFTAVADYIGGYDAIWGLILEQRAPDKTPAIRKPQVQRMNNLMELMAYDPYLTLQMGHFVRTDLAADNLFDEDMDFGEDFDYYLRLWSRHRCIKIPEALFLNRIGQSARGPRSGDGLQWRPHVHSVIRKFALANHLGGAVSLHEKRSLFSTPMPYDTIQTHHLAGRFHELEELEYLRQTLEPGLAIADIGAHVGNHSVYLWRYLTPRSLIPLECNPEIIGILKQNIGLNGMQEVNLSHLGVGIGRDNYRARIFSPDIRNTDTAKLVAATGGDIEVRPLDAMQCGPLEFLKIDVEGMELDVLAGAKNTIRRYRPNILVDVDDSQLPAFEQWLSENHYTICKQFKYPGHGNFHIAPGV